jgi:hypothetical protein
MEHFVIGGVMSLNSLALALSLMLGARDYFYDSSGARWNFSIACGIFSYLLGADKRAEACALFSETMRKFSLH